MKVLKLEMNNREFHKLYNYLNDNQEPFKQICPLIEKKTLEIIPGMEKLHEEKKRLCPAGKLVLNRPLKNVQEVYEADLSKFTTRRDKIEYVNNPKIKYPDAKAYILKPQIVIYTDINSELSFEEVLKIWETRELKVMNE